MFSVLLPGREEHLATALEIRGRIDPGFYSVVMSETSPIPEPQFPQLKNGTEAQKTTPTAPVKLNESQHKTSRHVRKSYVGQREGGMRATSVCIIDV